MEMYLNIFIKGVII